MKAHRVAERDGWQCWLCEGEVDSDAPTGSPWAATVDHVVPRSRGGKTVPENLRLAHRRCNGQRGNHLPELRWPVEFFLMDGPPLWQTLRRIVNRGGRSEIVAMAPTKETATQAADWAANVAERFLGGHWQTVVDPTGVADCHVIRLSVEGPVADPGKPVAPDHH